MSVLKKFDESGKEIGSWPTNITADNFQQYVDQYGIERAQGYCEAFSDLYYNLSANKPYPFTIHRMGVEAKKFLERNRVLLEQLNSILQSNQNKSTTDQKYTP